MIEVRIEKRRLDAFGSDVHANLHTLQRLRDAGVPMRGVLAPTVPESGRLEVELDDLGVEEYVYRWTP
jgi:hypothetical protein